MMLFKGIYTALITPFLQGSLDEEGLALNIQRQLEAKIDGIVLLGTTGESATLTEKEKERVIEIGVRVAKGKTQVIVGTGCNATHRTIENTRKAEALGADAALIVTPYYNKPTQEGIYRHFEAIAYGTRLPVLVYNIQGRTGVNIETSTLLKIASLPHMAGVKEASGNIMQAGEVLHALSEFTVLSGDDALTLPMMALGASGVISVVSNLIPNQMKALVDAALAGDFLKARTWHRFLLPLFKLAFIEVNPIPIKEAMARCGLPSGGCRLPLSSMDPENREKLFKQLVKMELCA